MKKTAIFLVTGILCLCLAACGTDTAASNGEITGIDWRTTGIVRDSGRIARNGETADVLICVHEKDATFYYDKEEQVPFGDVKYPTVINDPWGSYQSTDFADKNGDGNSDVSITFLLSDGNKTVMTWLWNGEQEAYVFNAELSS